MKRGQKVKYSLRGRFSHANEQQTSLSIQADSQKYALLSRVYSKFPLARASQSRAEPDNIESWLQNSGIENNFGVLCLDIDGNDYWVLELFFLAAGPVW